MNPLSAVAGRVFCYFFETDAHHTLRDRWRQARDQYQEAVDLGIGYAVAAGGWCCFWVAIPILGLMGILASAIDQEIVDALPNQVFLYAISVFMIAPAWLIFRHLVSRPEKAPSWRDDIVILILVVASCTLISLVPVN